MAISSPINIQNVSGSIRSLKLGLNRAKQSAGSIKTAILNRTIFKRQAIAGRKVLQNRRTENIGRRDQEDILEATGISGVFKRAGTVATESAKGFLGRILDFITTMLVGWLLYNLPTILTMVKDLIKRVQSLFSLLQGFISNVGKVFGDFGNIFNGVLYNVTHLDFLDSQKKVQTAMKGLESTFDDFNNQFEEGFKLLTTPLGEGAGEEPVPPTGTDFTTPTGGTTGSAGQWKPLLNLIASGEAKGGSYESMNPNTYLPGATRMTIAEVDRKATGAVGRYQFMTPSEQARSAGLDPNKDLFSPENQDRMAVALIEKKRHGKQWLSGKMTDAEFSEGLSNEWGALRSARGNVLPGNSGSIGFNKIKPVLQQVKFNTSPSNPLVQASNISQGSLPSLPRTNTIPGQNYGASRDGGSRKHAGVDFDISGPNAKFYSRIGGVVVGSPFRFGADGWATDIYNKELGVYERIAEAAKIVVKPGQTIKPGDLVAVGESNTGVIHYEIRKKIEGGFENSLDPISFLKNQKSQIAQVSPPTSPGQNVPQITQERRGQQIVYIDDRQPMIPSSPISGGGGGQASSQSVPEDGLNSLIKMQMLLDLAYT
jgi:murein DD-endopeptidase MepM/ murein hydrolase activator NlpD